MAAIVQFTLRAARDLGAVCVEASITVDRDPQVDSWDNDKARAHVDLARLLDETQRALAPPVDDGGFVVPSCRLRRMQLGLPYERSGCGKCGSILRPGWRCPEGR